MSVDSMKWYWDVPALVALAFVFQLAMWKSNLISQLGLYGFWGWESVGFFVAYWIGKSKGH